MWVILLEALAAAGLLIFIVWWTMFSGRPAGERRVEGPGERGTGEGTEAGSTTPPGRDDR